MVGNDGDIGGDARTRLGARLDAIALRMTVGADMVRAELPAKVEGYEDEVMAVLVSIDAMLDVLGDTYVDEPRRAAGRARIAAMTKA